MAKLIDTSQDRTEMIQALIYAVKEYRNEFVEICVRVESSHINLATFANAVGISYHQFYRRLKGRSFNREEFLKIQKLLDEKKDEGRSGLIRSK